MGQSDSLNNHDHAWFNLAYCVIHCSYFYRLIPSPNNYDYHSHSDNGKFSNGLNVHAYTRYKRVEFEDRNMERYCWDKLNFGSYYLCSSIPLRSDNFRSNSELNDSYFER